MTYTECIEFINSFSKSGKTQKNLERFRRLTNQLDNPQDSLRFIHVAGTNGKGSVCEYISNALTASGLKAGKFTSPFIFEINERIQIDGRNIPNDDLAEACEKVKAVISDEDLRDYSQFEIFTAIAFVYFKAENVDYVVLETGIGGLLDCTNIITPEVSVITMVDFDHCNLLGDKISEIATHKAGIIKENRPVFSAPFQHTETVEVLTKTAKEKNSKLVIVDENEIQVIKNSIFGTVFIYKGELYKTKMGGVHQPCNAALAIEVLKSLNIIDAWISKSLEGSQIPARMEVVNSEIPIIVDGGHNPSGTLAAYDLIKSEGLNPVLVCGMLSTKDCTASLVNLLKCTKHVVFTDNFSDLAEKAEVLCEIAEKNGVKGYVRHDEKSAVDKAMELYNEHSEINSIFVCGSLYLPCRIKEYLSLIMS